MTTLNVNETTSLTADAQTDATHRRRRLFACVFAVLLIGALLVWYVFFPWLLRNRVAAALRNVGITGVSFQIDRATPWGSELSKVVAGAESVLGINKVTLDYTFADLWNAHFTAIHMTGGRLKLTVQNGRVDINPLAKLVAHSQEAQEKSEPAKSGALPANRIDLSDAIVALKTERGEVDIPIDLILQGTENQQIAVTANLGPDKNLALAGTIDQNNQKLTFKGAAAAGWTLNTVRAIWPNAQVGVDGTLKLSGSCQWTPGTVASSCKIEIAPPAANAATAPVNSAKLHLTSGLFIVTANLDEKPKADVNVQNASFTVAGSALAAENVAGDVQFNSLLPLKSPLDQKLTVGKLTVGQMVLSDGRVSFQMSASDTINIRQTRWTWLAGEVFAQGIQIHSTPPGLDPIAVTAQVRDVQLKDLLTLFADGKASGDGKLSGFIPVTITGSKVDFGDGRISAMTGGTFQVKDRASVTSIAEAAATNAKSSISPVQLKANIIEALTDFEYEKLTTQLSNEDGKLVGYVRITGHGRTGAKQPVDYELRVNGIDKLLKAYVSIQAALPKSAALQKENATTGTPQKTK